MEELRSRARHKKISEARQLAMYLCRKYTSEFINAIAQAFGRSHSTNRPVIFLPVRATILESDVYLKTMPKKGGGQTLRSAPFLIILKYPKGPELLLHAPSFCSTPSSFCSTPPSLCSTPGVFKRLRRDFPQMSQCDIGGFSSNVTL
ncbi:helix-turn-helix domain-containing protein [Desulfacinum hydrothermale]|uniref:helix-turn-helix domain-containing protein n=1 Tax=Desulfacinum hydrothermale TaxID=109258 RepID=UPI000A073B3E